VGCPQGRATPLFRAVFLSHSLAEISHLA
jgi:hypothetical protein